MGRLLVMLIAAGAMSITSVGAARANQNPLTLRVGLTDDPDALTIGLGMIAASHGRGLRILPSVDLGFGDIGDADYLTLRGTANLGYAFPLSGRGQYVYPLFGASVYHVEADNADHTDLGINLGVGFEISQVSIELIAGFDDVPNVSLTVAFVL